VRAPAPPRLIAARAAMPQECVDQRVLAMRPERMHVHAGRLVDDEHVVILVVHDERQRLRSHRARRDRRGLDGHHGTLRHRIRDRSRTPVDRQRAALDQLADLADRQDDEMRLRVVDQPQRYRPIAQSNRLPPAGYLYMPVKHISLSEPSPNWSVVPVLLTYVQ